MRVFGDMLGGVGYQLERLFERTKGRLFRKYAALLVALVGTALVLSTAIETYYSFHENREASAAVQREKAVGAATIIEQFLKEIEGQVGWTTHASFVPGQSGADQRRFDFLRLFRQAPAVTEVSYIDGQGREQLKVSRLSMDVIGSNIDRSLEPHFKEAKSRRRHVGEVYFRKESEPYLTLSVGGTGRNVGVAVAEVNLKFIWDVISRLKVGRTGAAYVIDNRGLLIAHQDIGLVLRKTDLSALTHVAAAREARPAPGIGVAFPEIVRDPQGREVLTAFAAIETLGWNVFVDLPVKEAYEPVYASMMRSGVVLLGGLGLAGLAGMWLAQRMVVPIRTLATGAAKIGAGDLDYRLAIKTGDEVEALADGFNEMGARLKESYQGLERKVETRTRELQSSLVRQTAMSEVLAVISSSPGQVEPVFEAILSSARRLCNAGFGHFLLFDGERWHAEALQNVPPAYAEFWRKEPVIAGPETNLGRVQRSGKFDQVEDVLLGQGYRSRAPLGVATAELGGARTLLTVPLIKKHKIIGAIALYRTDVCAFDNSEILLLETFADQAVIAIENTRLFEEVQTRTRELARSVSELEALGEVGRAVSSTLDLEQVLETVVRKARDLGTAEGAAIFRYKESDDTFRLWHSSGLDFVLEDQVRGLKLKAEDTLMARAIKTRQALQLDDIERGPENALRKLALTAGFRSALFVPLARADRAFGVLVLQRRQTGSFDDATISLLQTFASQSVLAIQNARLFREIEEKGLQLAVASKHKSQFLANMSYRI